MQEFNFNGNIIRRHDFEFLCLTDMWRAAGSLVGRQPSHWLRTAFARNFIDFIAESGTVKKQFRKEQLVQTVRGGPEGGKTYAHWQIAMGYAKDLSPEFQEWANRVIRNHMEERYNVSAGEGVSAALAKDGPTLDALIKIGEAVHEQSKGITKLLEGQERTDEKIVSIDIKVDSIENRLEVVEKSIQYKRKRVNESVRKAHLEFAKAAGILCPCCNEKEMFEDGDRFVGNIDHFWKASRADIGATWPVCRDCNTSIDVGERRGESDIFFKAYQKRLSKFNGPLFSRIIS